MARIGEDFLMKVIDNIPVEFDMDELLRNLGVGRVRRLKGEEITPLIDECRGLIEPKAVYTFESVRKIEKDEILLKSGHTLKSIILADTLENDQEVAPYVVTIGPRLEKHASEESRNSILRGWTLDSIGDYALGKAAAYIRSRVEEKLGSHISGFGPGTGTGRLFSIEQQQVLFQILDPPRNIGVSLTASYLMVPRKSVSGILAATSQEYVACQYCPREKCENRRKPFSGEYYSLKCENEGRQ